MNALKYVLLMFGFVLAAGAAPNAHAATGNDTTAILSVDGMTCGGCAVSVKSALESVDGVHTVVVSVKEKKAEVRYDASKTNPEEMAAAVTKAGFEAAPSEPEPSEE